ncbi:MAG TPA: MFS transporter [Anaerovoracaceae bacterium]|nr:MFS transporter [Anaerovoracaceae bacterium]
MKDKNFYGYKAAVGAFLVIFVNLGVCTTLGVFITSLSEYSGWPLGICGYIGTVNTIGNVILSLVAVKSMAKYSTKATMLISVIACALHVNFYCFATPGANLTSLICMYIAGFLASFAITFGTHAVCSTVIADWFIEKRGQITGIVFSGAGFGAAIWVFLAGQLFQYMDYKDSYRVISVLTLAIGLSAILFLIKDPKKMGQKPLGWEKAEELEQAAAVGAGSIAGVDKKTALRSPSFWLLSIALLCICAAGAAFMSYAPAWWQMNGLTSTQASNWDALYLIASGLVLLVVGKVTAKISPSVFAIVVCIAFALCMASMVLWGGNPVTMLLVLSVLFGAMAYPLNASIPGLMGQSIFGMKDFAAISAVLMTAVYCGQALYAPIMAQFLAGEGGMASGWKFFGAAALVGMVFILISIAKAPVKKLTKAEMK